MGPWAKWAHGPSGPMGQWAHGPVGPWARAWAGTRAQGPGPSDPGPSGPVGRVTGQGAMKKLKSEWMHSGNSSAAVAVIAVHPQK